MSKPITANAMTCCQAAVIWQPYIDGAGSEPALLVHSDACGLLVIQQEERHVLIQRETLPELIKQLKRLAAEDPSQ
ncbi:MAG: hypothetical protein KJ989_13200 [Gammaproteobacteria bacterium]|uniref:Uncharacterized protein n=1 Tax=viral metagenome TaxID=1070528 RepID=A0A6M3KKU9_9ZZZZ|nr:hypothetical protein [Gammaproteobacteria bacterium]MBU2157171.1 hypothetical protein [Gammaproteobacteria bacterium]MBU2256085.1 hypothetical protein [Gammaproteobacteria bacterium]MBU2295153.1 hypothetical protein [Gammaproteobacteria bacterium]